jgi:PiT family inorganic phosphate transporter
LGGWRIIRTVGRRIYRIQPIDGLASQSSSSGVIFGASLLGAPVSTTQIVASSIVGIGVGRGRRRHVHWMIVRDMGLAWIITLPAAGVLGAATLAVTRWLT